MNGWWIHVKTGKRYRVLGTGFREDSMLVEIYYLRADDGRRFHRPLASWMEKVAVTDEVIDAMYDAGFPLPFVDENRRRVDFLNRFLPLGKYGVVLDPYEGKILPP